MRKNLFLLFCGLFITATVCSQEYIFKPITSLADITNGSEVIFVLESGNPSVPNQAIAVYHGSNASITSKTQSSFTITNRSLPATMASNYIFTVEGVSNGGASCRFTYNNGSQRYMHLYRNSNKGNEPDIEGSTSSSGCSLVLGWNAVTKTAIIHTGTSTYDLHLACYGAKTNDPKLSVSNGASDTYFYQYVQLSALNIGSSSTTTATSGQWTIFKKVVAYTLTLDKAGNGDNETMLGGCASLPRLAASSSPFLYWQDDFGNIYKPGTSYPTDGSALTANTTLHAVYKDAMLIYEQITSVDEIEDGDTLVFTLGNGKTIGEEYALYNNSGTLRLHKEANVYSATGHSSFPESYKFIVKHSPNGGSKFLLYSPSQEKYLVFYDNSGTYNFYFYSQISSVNNLKNGRYHQIQILPCGDNQHFNLANYYDNSSSYFRYLTYRKSGEPYITITGKESLTHQWTSKLDFTSTGVGDWTIYRSYYQVPAICSFSIDPTKGTCEIQEMSATDVTFPQVQVIDPQYEFLGWEGNNQIYQPGEHASFKNDISFTAKFGLIKIRLNLNGHGTWEEGGEQVKDIDGRYIENYPTVIPKDGYRFSGWSLTSAGEPLPAGRYPATGEINQTTTLYAVYDATVVYLPIRSSSELEGGKEYILAMQGGVNQDQVFACGLPATALNVPSSVDISQHSKNGTITFPPTTVVATLIETNGKYAFAYKQSETTTYYFYSHLDAQSGVRLDFSTSLPVSEDYRFSIYFSNGHVTLSHKDSYSYTGYLHRYQQQWSIGRGDYLDQFTAGKDLNQITEYPWPNVFTLYRKYEAEQISLDAGGAVCPITKAYGAINALPLVFRTVDGQKQEVYWWEDEEGNHYLPGTRFPTSGAVESPVTLTAVYRAYDIKYKPIDALTDMQAGDTIALVMEDGNGGDSRFALQIGQGTLTTSAFDATNVPLSQRIVVVEKGYVYKSVNNTSTYLTSASFRSGAYPTYNLIRYEPNLFSGAEGNYTFESATGAAHKYALYIPNDAFPSHVQIFDVYNYNSSSRAINLIYSPSSNTVSTRQQANTFTCYCDQFADNKALSEMGSAATWTIYKRHIKYAYPITYDANGGTISPTTVCGWDITLAAATAPIGYEQIGWATTQANADNQIADAGEVGDSYEASEPITLFAVYKPIVLTLTESESNSELLATYNSQQVAQIDMNRTVTPNQLNTFCAPFDMDEQEIKNVFGADTKLYEMASADLNGEILTIHFDDVEPMAIAAGYPYLIEPTQTINDELFTVHTISNTLTTQTTGNVDFIPVFDPTILSVDSDILFLGASNLLYRPYTTGQIKGLRAYFQLKNGAQVAQRVVLSSVRQIPTALPATNQLINARKVIRKGQLFIYVNDKIYNAQGIQY